MATSKYWRYAKRLAEEKNGAHALQVLPNRKPFHVVTHRAIGDIPGCTPAPREHTFKDTTLEEARMITSERAGLYCKALYKYVSGEYGGERGLEEMWSDISRIPPLFGPHGEKL